MQTSMTNMTLRKVDREDGAFRPLLKPNGIKERIDLFFETIYNKDKGASRMEQEKKLYACETRDCRFLFESEEEPERCTECGKKNIRLANVKEQAEYEKRKKEFNL